MLLCSAQNWNQIGSSCILKQNCDLIGYSDIFNKKYDLIRSCDILEGELQPPRLHTG